MINAIFLGYAAQLPDIEKSTPGNQTTVENSTRKPSLHPFSTMTSSDIESEGLFCSTELRSHRRILPIHMTYDILKHPNNIGCQKKETRFNFFYVVKFYPVSYSNYQTPVFNKTHSGILYLCAKKINLTVMKNMTSIITPFVYCLHAYKNSLLSIT